MPTSVRGFCPQLKSAFGSTKALSSASVVVAVDKVLPVGLEVHPANNKRYSVETIEITRASDVIGARHSIDPSTDNSFEPFYANESDGGILSRYSDASRSGTCVDLGDLDENADSAVFPPFDEGLGNETLMAFDPSPIVDDDRDAVEERKSTESLPIPQIKQVRQANRTALAKTKISELVSETFRVNFDSYPQTTQQLDNLELNRTNVFHSLLVNEFSNKPVITFDELSAGVSKRVAACSFLEVLQLKTWGRIDAVQSTPFGGISLTQATSLVMQ